MLLLSLTVAYSGFIALSLSLQRHYRDVFDKMPSPHITSGLRVTGYSLLVIDLWACITLFNASVGIVVWFGMLSTAAFLAVGLLAWKPRSAIWLGIVAPTLLVPLLTLTGTKG